MFIAASVNVELGKRAASFRDWYRQFRYFPEQVTQNFGYFPETAGLSPCGLRLQFALDAARTEMDWSLPVPQLAAAAARLNRLDLGQDC